MLSFVSNSKLATENLLLFILKNFQTFYIYKKEGVFNNLL